MQVPVSVINTAIFRRSKRGFPFFLVWRRRSPEHPCEHIVVPHPVQARGGFLLSPGSDQVEHNCCKFICSGCLGYFHALTVNKAAMTRVVQIPLRDADFTSFSYKPGGGIAGPCGSPIFESFEEPPSVFHSGCISLHSQQQWIGLRFLCILTNNSLSLVNG